MVLDPRELLKSREAEGAPPVPLGGSRAERLQRLQIGLFGIVAMILLIGLADIVISRAQQTEAITVPEAAPTVVASETSTPRDPLADAGVVPELPTSPSSSPNSSASPGTGDLPPPTSTPIPNAPLQ